MEVCEEACEGCAVWRCAWGNVTWMCGAGGGAGGVRKEVCEEACEGVCRVEVCVENAMWMCGAGGVMGGGANASSSVSDASG